MNWNLWNDNTIVVLSVLVNNNSFVALVLLSIIFDGCCICTDAIIDITPHTVHPNDVVISRYSRTQGIKNFDFIRNFDF